MGEELPYKDACIAWTKRPACLGATTRTITRRRKCARAARSSRRPWPTASTGGLLLHLTIEDMEKIGETAGRRGRRPVRPEVRSGTASPSCFHPRVPEISTAHEPVGTG